VATLKGKNYKINKSLIEKLKSEYKFFLDEKYPNCDSTYKFDPFYPIKNDIGMDFWDIFVDDSTIRQATLLVIKHHETKKKSDGTSYSPSTAKSYKNKFLRLKEFFDTKYNGVQDYLNKHNFYYTYQTNSYNETKLEKNKMRNQPLNQILYGPPGTGKTYSTKGLIELIIKENFISSQKKNINVDELYWYSAIALSMYKNDKTKKYKVGELLQQDIVKEFAQSRNSKNLYSSVIGQLQIHTDENSKTVNYTAKTPPSIFDKDENGEWFLTKEGIVFVEESFKEYLSNETRKTSNNDFVRFITFHQTYSYEEFVEGIRINLEDDCEEVKYSLQNGIFKEICIEANADPNNKYAIVIDEINRGDISKIFGELITLIEDDKRVTPNGERSFDNTEIQNNQLLVTLPYSKKKFGVPSNLYIIGTMNTADRSIALLDIALRRRFDFISTYPNAEIIGTDGALTEVNGIDLKLFLNKMNKRIEAYLDKDHTIGHSYLMEINSYEDFLYKFKNRILSLLLEYFYNDYEKVAKILNQDDFENSEYQIIQKECLIDDIPTYNINEKYPLEAFKKVCK